MPPTTAEPAIASVLESAAAALDLELDATALERILRFGDMLDVWNRRLRLTGERAPIVIARRHTADSLAVVPLLPSRGAVIDIGSGQGFPGIILACVRPDLRVVLLESRRRRVSFLRDVVRHVALSNVEAVETRAETAAQDATLAGRGDVVVARAIQLKVFLRLARPLTAARGRAVAMQSVSDRGSAVDPRAHGFRLDQERRYHVPGNPTRRLLVFTPDEFTSPLSL